MPPVACEICVYANEHGSWPTDHRGTHCKGSRLSLFSIWDGDPVFGSHGVVGSLQLPPDSRRVDAHQPSDLDGAQAFIVEPLRFFHVDQAMRMPMLFSTQHSEVLWSVIGLDVVDVVDITVGEASDEPMLVTLDVILGSDLPSKPDISVAGQVSVRFVARDILDAADLSGPPFGSIKGGALAAPSLSVADILHYGSATLADSIVGHLTHGPMLAAIQGCHRSWGGKRESHCPECHLHFSADSVADKHRARGVCLDAADLHNLVSKAGKPVLRVVDTPNGEMWRFAASLPVISKPRWAAE